ncbi:MULTISPECIES: glycosyltransferase family 9 protein [unclassified Rhizobacter]|uniref:glycosyltransferase family 9 protein n=1 Tax=unclassified Rhizobacter TaxID=2640088 RepID=UPI000A581CA4|nr:MULTISPECIES: glycosyltransferase family 9 protein [unclassified Rhizobacter]
MTAPGWRDARKVLAVRLDNLGDVLMTTPALTAIRRSAPGMHLTLLGSRAGAALRPYVPAIDEVIVYDAPWMKGGAPAAGALSDRRLLATLARGGFDAAVIFTVCTQSALPAALMCRLAGIPLRLAHCRENPYELLSDWVPDTEVCRTGMRHEVQRQLDLVHSVGFHERERERGLVFHERPGDAQAMRRKLLQAGGDPDRPYLVVHPGASAPSRRYPAERFGQAVTAIVAQTGCQVVLTGSADERPLLALVESGLAAPLRASAVSLAGALNLGELSALIAQSQVLLCNNSGPAHLAAAVGAPVVVLYALTNPQHTPWQAQSRVLNHEVPCRDCLKSSCPQLHHDCLRKVPPERVAEAACELMRDGRPLPRAAAAAAQAPWTVVQ